MAQRLLGSALLLLSLFTLLGFIRVRPGGGLVLAVTFLLAVVLPAAAGAYLWWGASAGRAAAEADLRRHQDRLRRVTLEAELIKLAARRGGKLTVVEAVAELAFDSETIADVLEKMAVRGLVEVQVSESGVLVYSFYDVQHLDEKDGAKGPLDA